MVVANDWIDIEINKKQVCHYVGYDTDSKLSVRIASLMDEYIENAHHLIEPSYTYVIRDVERVKGSTVVIEGSITFESEVIARLLERCRKAAIFLVTIGERLEETACRLAEDGLILQSTVLDAIGSNAAERVADFIHDQIEEISNSQGLTTSRRFSPGYCDWDISQQGMIFRAMDGDMAGIRLNEKCLMIPRKSISGIIGIGYSNDGVKNYNPCKTCGRDDCVGRR